MTMGFKLIDGQPDIREYPIDETHGSFLAGDLVNLSSGEVVLGATTNSIFGVALKSYAAGSGEYVPVNIIHASQTYLCEADTTTTTAMCGVGYGLNQAAGTMAVDIGDTGDVSVVIVQLDPRDGAYTGSGGRVHVRFPAAILQAEKDA